MDDKNKHIAELESEVAALKARLNSEFDSVLTTREKLLVEAERVAHLGSWSWDLTTGAIQWSDEFFRILGFSPGSVEATSEGFFTAMHEQDRERVQRVAQESLAAGDPEPIDFRIRRPDGSIRQVHMEAGLTFDEEGKPRSLVGTVLDQTEGHRREQLLQRLISELEEAQAVARLGSFRLYLEEAEPTLDWSPGLAAVLGLPAQTQCSVERYMACVHPDDLERVQERFGEALQNPKELDHSEPVEYRIVQPQGAVREVVSHASELRDEEGNAVGFQGVVQDVTEHKALEAQLRQSQKMEAIGNLAGGIAHDFNNYLTVLTGNGDLLAELVPVGSAAREYVDAINDVTLRCTHLTRQLLLFSRKGSVEATRIDLREALKRMAPVLRSMMGETVSLVLDLGSGSSDIVADTVQIEQAVSNLCLNARDAMARGGAVRLAVESVYEDSAGKPKAWVRLRVEDTGCGISKQNQGRIFEPFFTTKAMGKGTGLGLATTYGIVRDAGGRIEVESEEGKGTTFTLLFPKSSVGETRAAS